MRQNAVIESQYYTQRAEIVSVLERLLGLTQQTGYVPMVQTVTDLLERVEEPFLFVIVGEVKSGKSSFINALLDTGRDICAVAPSPMTDTIQQITYGDREVTEIINPFLKRVYIPEETLRDIAIVDTPGTNTIIVHHQEITERFIPGADLIVFVFEAKNPYRHSAWEFFNFIHQDWRKKVVFVLQQKDLMSSQDLKVNHDGVIRLARENGISNPLVFNVSALLEQQGQKEDSGFGPLRDYIRKHITGGNAPLMKLRSTADTALNVAVKIEEAIALRQEQYRADVAFREDIRISLQQQERLAQSQVTVLIDSLLGDYDRITHQKEKELAGVLSFTSVLGRSISGIFSRKTSLKEWLHDFSTSLDTALASGLRDKMNDRVVDLAESIQQMGQMVDLKIRSSKTILQNDMEIFSDIAERRTRILSDLRDAFRSFLTKAENFGDEGLLAGHERVAPKVFTGSGITVIGVVLTALTNGAVFDITGGVITTIGVIFTGVTLGIQRRRILRRYHEEMARGRNKLVSEITSKLNQYISDIKQRIDSNFHAFDQMLVEEGKQLERLTSEHSSIVNILQVVIKSLRKA
ncbi:MAG TPA: dynamin family protein [Saprospiraceae bacterium]|nr:dynamin family protein [Saprospiraceae bacterium]